jgi:hypothetical protein
MSKPSAKPSPIKTQDVPFDLDAVEREASGKEYHFTLGGNDFVMPALGRLDRKAIKRLGKLAASGEIDNLEFIDETLALALGPDQFAKFDELPLSQAGVQALFEDWSTHSGVDVPESSASTDS